MTMRPLATAVLTLALVAAASATLIMGVDAAHARTGAQPAPAPATSATVARGLYLVRAGDCSSCHTARDGKPYAGGRAIVTPFGIVYSVNITPDRDTGIGKWTSQDFYRALHEGKGADGHRLYPAMPYPSYTKVTRADVDAMRAYLATVTPVHNPNKPTQLPWPMSWRFSMWGWNLLFFHAGTYQPTRNQSAQWNRGAYLAEGLGHCSACHTPRNFLGAPKTNQRYQGGNSGQHWYAPGLDTDLHDGIGGWSNAEIAQYLKTGMNAKSAAAGPMAEVVLHSTQYLSDADLTAIAVYLKQRPGAGSKQSPSVKTPDQKIMARGQAIYTDNCAGCHMADGRGMSKVFPPLGGSAAIQADQPGTVLHVVLQGARMAAPSTLVTGQAMPGFGWKLTNQDVADVATFIRNSWGNRASPVNAGQVAAVRKDLQVADNPSGDLTKHPDAKAHPELWQPMDNASQMPIKPVKPTNAPRIDMMPASAHSG